MSYFIATLLALLGCAAVILTLKYIEFLAARQREYGEAACEFFEAAAPLAADDETPEKILLGIDSLNQTITDRRAALSILSYIRSERWQKVDGSVAELNKVHAEFFHKRPELEQPYRRAVVGWFKAVTALSPIVGKLARFSVTAPDVEPATFRAAKRIASKRENSDHHHGGARRAHA